MTNDQLILNRYKPLSHAGSGGFGSVVVAWDTRIQRKVAIKTIQLSERDVARAALPGADAVSERFAPQRQGAPQAVEADGLSREGAAGSSAGAAQGRGGKAEPAADGTGPLPWESDDEYRIRTGVGAADGVQPEKGGSGSEAAPAPQTTSAALPRPGHYAMQDPKAAYDALAGGPSIGELLADAPLTWAAAEGTVTIEDGRVVPVGTADVADAVGLRVPETLVMEREPGTAGSEGDEADEGLDPREAALREAMAQEPELGPDGQPLVRALAHVPGLDEARTAATLNDESIVGVYDFEIRDTTAYLIMEYVEGMTLTQFVSVYDSTLTLDMIAAVLQAVSRALGVAHENGVLHLDIKPDNVLINAKGQVKVTDFGLATLADASGQGVAGGGTIGYMPLEQMRQQPLDVRCDEWALASMMYWLLAGSNPFLARDLKGAEAAIENAELVLPSLCWEDMAPELDDVVFQALDPEVDERFDSVQEFAKAMKPFLGSAKKGKKQLAELVDAELRGDVEEEASDAEEEFPAEPAWAPREPGLPLCYRITPWHRAIGAAVAGAAGSGVLAACGWALMDMTSGFANPLFWGLSGLVALVGALSPWVGALISCVVLGVGLVVAGAPALGVVVMAAAAAWGLYCGRTASAQANAGMTFPLAGCVGFGMLAPLMAGFTARPLRALATTAFSCLLALTLSSIGLAAGAAGNGDSAGAGSSSVEAPALPFESYSLPAVLDAATAAKQAGGSAQPAEKRQVEGAEPDETASTGDSASGDAVGDAASGAAAPDDAAGAVAADGPASLAGAADAAGLPGLPVAAGNAPCDIQGAVFAQLTAPQTWAVVVSWLAAAALLSLVRLRRSRAAAVAGVAAAAVALGVGICAAAYLAVGGRSTMPSPWSMASLVGCVALMLVACAAIPAYSYTDDADIPEDAEAEKAAE